MYLLNTIYREREVNPMRDKQNYTVGGESIRLRLTNDMKEWLFNKASCEDRTVSDIMRELIRREMTK